MHRIAATPGGWNPQDEGVVILEQTPAPIVILTAADTDIQTLAATLPHLPPQFPDIRVANLLHLVQQLSIDDYAERVLQHAQVIVVRLLGGRAYWSYGLEVVKELAENQGMALVVMPGEDAPDMELMSHSTVSLQQVNRLWRYWSEGGVENIRNGLLFLAGSVGAGDLGAGSIDSVSVRAGSGRSWWEVQNIGEPAPTASRWEGDNIAEPKPIPKVGVLPQNQDLGQNWPKVGILFYRAHYCAGNTAPIESLCQALVQRQLTPVPVFVSSLRDNAPHRSGDRHCQEEILHLFQPPDNPPIQVLLNTTSFAIQSLQTKESTPLFFSILDVPTLQVILSSSTVEQWQQGNRGLLPRDVAMNIALPEVDGRIITRAISFKATQTYNEQLQTDVVQYQPVADRVNFVADLAKNWVKLRQKPAKERKIALILANYPTRDGRLANGVGLDTPASCVQILAALHQAGYQLQDIPETGEDLITRLTAGVTNDLEGNEIRLNRGGMGEWGNGEMGLSLSQDDYERMFEQLPVEVQQGINNRWGSGVGAGSSISGWQDDRTREPALPERWVTQPMTSSSYPDVRAGSPVSRLEDQKLGEPAPTGGKNAGEPAPTGFAIAGLNLGNVFVGIQPSRGYDLDPSLNYHAPDLEPTPHYLAFYQWIKDIFQADAVIHVGKHGNLEWLPGKGLALSECCYPEVALGTMPHLYPFIVNDPGEGSQAKRRSQAVILDHLTPPLTRAELYGPLQQLETLVDEYYEADSLDPSRLPAIQSRITALIRQEHLDQDLGLTPEDLTGITCQLSTRIDGYLCELKEAQIRDGLHIFGQCPQGRQLRDLIIAISRSRPQGITRALAEDLGLDFDPLTTDPTTQLAPPVVIENKTYHQVGDIVEQLEKLAANYVDQLLVGAGSPISGCEDENAGEPALTSGYEDPMTGVSYRAVGSVRAGSRISGWEDGMVGEPAPTTQNELNWIAETLYPQLQATRQEITNLLRGLDGRYIPSGPSGAPTRGRAEVLPTGRNFYSVDIRAIPTETAWGMARKAAEALIERYTQENGEYPKTLGLSMWGTSAMRTGGEDLAEALWLLGVQPVWDGPSRRVVDFEVVPVSVLGRPRVDVTLRISGFFRDGFPNLIDLFNQVVEKVAALDEPEEENPLAGTVRRETEKWRELGLSEEQAKGRSQYRMFGSKPGAYGAGLQGLIESQNWHSDEDLARAYLNWSSYAYTGQGDGQSAPEVFAQRLQDLQVVLHNQDNREHDLLDSDDYYQFQGGLTAAVRSLKGENPTVYFGDHAVMNHPRIRTLQEEINRVYRSRVVNPKWIAGVMRHGYKGAFEMAATVDYLFAYDATTHCVADHIYEGVSDAYLLDPKVQEFVEKHNPWALRDMAERLLEAHQRGLWTSASAERVDQLRAIVHQAEASIE
jgi:cobaltochelatase CobN